MWVETGSLICIVLHKRATCKEVIIPRQAHEIKSLTKKGSKQNALLASRETEHHWEKKNPATKSNVNHTILTPKSDVGKRVQKPAWVENHERKWNKSYKKQLLMQISFELFVYNHKNKQVLHVQFTLQIFVHDYLKFMICSWILTCQLEVIKSKQIRVKWEKNKSKRG